MTDYRDDGDLPEFPEPDGSHGRHRAPGSPDAGAFGHPDDELFVTTELRRRLNAAVAPIEPSAGSLRRLRTAVRARRRRRQAMVTGGAVALVTSCTVVAAMLGPNAINSGVFPGGGSENAENASQARPGAATGDRTRPDNPSGSGSPGAPNRTTKPNPATPPPRGGETKPGQKPASPPSTQQPVAACAAGALRKTDKSELVDGGDGNGYGYLELANDATAACTVAGPPKLSIVDAAGGADQEFGLELRSETASPKLAPVPDADRTLVLLPGEAFRFQFAWTNKAADAASCAGPQSANSGRTWALHYRVGDAVVVDRLALPAACKGTIYRTGLYRPGEFLESFGGGRTGTTATPDSDPATP